MKKRIALAALMGFAVGVLVTDYAFESALDRIFGPNYAWQPTESDRSLAA